MLDQDSGVEIGGEFHLNGVKDFRLLMIIDVPGDELYC
jgi:hypothetical protein